MAGRALTRPALETRLWLWQRASAVVLALAVVVHLAVIVYATRRGLDAAALLARTRGNAGYGAFYAAFVVACAVHVPIGLRAILHEWLHWRGRAADVAAAFAGVVVLGLGLRAVYAVFVP
jgi:fumarate reductase subunit C